MTNPGLIDIREQIFGYFDLKTLKNCREAFAEKFGEDLDLWLERLILVQNIFELGEVTMMVFHSIPGWDKATKKFGKMASLDDLNEIKGLLELVLVDDSIMWHTMCKYNPLPYVAMKGYVKLMELLLHTDLNINEINDGRVGRAPFIEACDAGRTEIVNLMITVSKEHGIDLNAKCSFHLRTGLMVACINGHKEIVNLMITASKEYGIDLNASNRFGWTGFFYACQEGHTEIVKLMIENRAKYGINIQTEDNYGRTALDLVNKEIEYEWSVRGGRKSEKEKASYKELKRILEKAYLEDNDPQPTVKKYRTQ